MDVTKRYGATQAVAGVSLELPAGDTLALLGPSGCGKSTLLRLIAGLEPLDAGTITLGGRNISRVPAQKRTIGMVFQDYALFPHLSVGDNVRYGLVEKGWSKQAQRERVVELLELVGLSGFETRRSFELSGGEQQRVALARALAPKPPVLLLDEPLSNLDLALRDELKAQLKELLAQLETSTIYVTHDQGEAFTLARQVAVMRRGKILQQGTPDTLYGTPRSVWLAKFLGHRNLYRTREHPILNTFKGHPIDSAHTLLRTDLITLGRGPHQATLTSRTRTGALHELELTLSPHPLPLIWSGFTRELPQEVQPGDTLPLHIPPDAVVELAEES